ncbi:fatty acid desaturase-domain-containing protein [Gilbertella persicaria]|uniref:fatty acid desaturase-domain-containing protein n=1 Tax=Gilbertella persicaria TaxID=101096 RepID=UPI002220E8B2|nr:fatty acid desaturase-domain-containing protein [Gilbertella persicaria]KAI8061832.1 fatty acid desaturase-domain-containing protein [Gilbertella persicaria]
MPPFVFDVPQQRPPKNKHHPDYRHPLYVGSWKRSIPGQDKDFARDDMDEPHLKRKHAMSLTYSDQIQKLYGSDIRTFHVATFINLIQLGLAYYFGHQGSHWSTFVLVAYLVGGTATGIVGVIIHEACHNLVTGSSIYDRLIGLYTNIALPVPISQSFRRYHIQHHTWQGVEGLDPDLPLEWEKNLIQGNSIKKILWLLIYPVMYVTRGLVMQQRRGHTPGKWEWINLVFSIAMDALVVLLCGWKGLGYLFLSLWFGYSLHPGAAHFIQEHYTFDDGQETYSYYGILNIPFMNIGYHNEHHDFQKIPWSNLPALRSLASEYYDTLSFHTSWLKVHWKFITQRSMGPQSRVIRDYDTFKKGRSLISKIRAYNQNKRE